MEKGAARLATQRGCELLRTGHFGEGWDEYEQRHVAARMKLPAGMKAWQGEPLERVPLFVFKEQGIGDEIMFGSCIPDALKRVTTCYIACDARLVPLYERVFTGAHVCSEFDASVVAGVADLSPKYGIHVGSLGRLFRRQLADFTGAAYLEAAVGSRALGRPGRPRVGISWQGGIPPDKLRMAPWHLWHDILDSGLGEFVNVQYGNNRPTLEMIRHKWGVKILDPGVAVDGSDFVALCETLRACDVVITVPNTLAHCAGAMGIPTLLIHDPAWGCFWITDGERCPWYRSVRVVKYSRDRGWSGVAENVCQQLSKAARTRHGASLLVE